MKTAIVTDSTAVVDKEFVKSNPNVYIVPLHLMIKDHDYADGVDLTQEMFFQMMDQSSIIPTTSQPSVGEILELFEMLKSKYDQILYITISSKISGTYSTGKLAMNQIEGIEIEVFDSLHTSAIQLMFVKEAVRLASKGKTIHEIVSILEILREKAAIYLIVDDLKHLARTGRVNNVSAIIGTLLKIKPILKFEDGYINLHKKVRSLSKAYQDVIEIAKAEQLNCSSLIMVAHANSHQNAVKIRDMLKKIYPNHDIEICELSPVISVHTGPNSVGVAWLKKV